jgi:cytochrome P450
MLDITLIVVFIHKVGLQRMTIREGTLRDGTVVPPGYIVALDISTIHKDPAVYPRPDGFNPLHFSSVREQDADDAKQAFATVDKDVSIRFVLSFIL